MKDFLKNKKIPTILGILILVIGIAAGVFLVQSRQLFRLRASPEINPKDIRITNISDSAFSVSWTTDKETQGFVIWGENESLLDKTAATNINYSSNTHYINIYGLNPETTYFFRINSDGKEFDNNNIPWKVATGNKITTPPESIVVSGSILTSSGTPAKNAIVYAQISGNSMLSTLTSENGNWLIPISSARTQDLKSYVQIDKTSSVVDITIHAGPLGVSFAQIYPESANPVPEITLGQVYDFKNLVPNQDTQIPDAEIGLPEDSTKSSGFSVPSESTESDTDVTLNSLNEGEVISTNEPEFFGEGLADDVRAAVDGMTAMIEPMLTVGMGAMVIVLALAIFLPMWNVSANRNPGPW